MGCWKLINDAKSVGSWGSAPDPDGGAYSAPPYPLAAIVPLPSLIIHYGHPPHSIPVSAPADTSAIVKGGGVGGGGGVSRVSSGPQGVKGPPSPENTYRHPIVRLCGIPQYAHFII